ncbi:MULTISPECIES: RrF2 family transcriptional regulator [unclassified Paenibacillus]|jgi:Rrf2 family transcriptional regulator, nitric oxide-sensitive transcriptional repressor|uniref:RrF2 family transcriptional regulator n=1 Tax=unclassified Paenibacillus TaxID=185978 RepID=UPI00096CD60C|nr:Rrf2 family transcriptional regulator [Paenibacillus sp. FSL H8-0259]OMF31128.1 transcriptional regulator [Paenibacillus sp. FSL H8-0259]
MAELKRFGYGLQALVVLASAKEQYSSREIAEQIRCEPTALRKILSRLTEAGYIEVRQGRGGGYMLAKQPGDITLAEVYLSMHDDVPMLDGMLDTTGNHLFGQKVRQSFDQIMTDIRFQVEHVLKSYTVADLVE